MRSRAATTTRLASWYVSLATDIADPVERLQAVARNTATGRDTLRAKDLTLQSAMAASCGRGQESEGPSESEVANP
jgi:hypothetical protein